MLVHREWYISGPFPENWNFFSAIEGTTEVDFGASGMYNGLVGRENWELAPGYWRNHAEPKNIRAFFERREVPVEYCSCYVATEIVASEDCWVELTLRYDDAVKLWINGTKVFEDPQYRNMGADDVTVEAQLKKGKNLLLFRVIQGREAWALAFSARQIEAPAWMAEADRIIDLLKRRGALATKVVEPGVVETPTKPVVEIVTLDDIKQFFLSAWDCLNFHKIKPESVNENFIRWLSDEIRKIKKVKIQEWIRLWLSDVRTFEVDGQTVNETRVFVNMDEAGLIIGYSIRFRGGDLSIVYCPKPVAPKKKSKWAGKAATRAKKTTAPAKPVEESAPAGDEFADLKKAIGGPIMNGEIDKIIGMGIRTPQGFLDQTEDMPALIELTGLPEDRLKKATRKAKDWVKKNRSKEDWQTL